MIRLENLSVARRMAVIANAPLLAALAFGAYIVLTVDVAGQSDPARAALIAAALLIFGVALLCRLVARSISRSLGRIAAAMSALTLGDISTSATSLDPDRPDEIGVFARAIMMFREAAVTRENLEAQASAERRRELERQENLSRSIAQFQTHIGEVVDALARETMEMSFAALQLTEAAQSAERAGADALGQVEDHRETFRPFRRRRNNCPPRWRR